MKSTIAVLVIATLAMNAAHSSIFIVNDKAILEETEGHLIVPDKTLSATLHHISGVPVQITVNPKIPNAWFIIPDEVTADSESIVGVTVGSETINLTLKIINEVEPEKAKDKSIAQCTFYNDDDQGHTGIAGTGMFSFDKRTVNNLYIGYTREFDFTTHIISTTRSIIDFLFPGLTVFEDDGERQISKGFGFRRAWYADAGHQAGQVRLEGRYGTSLNDGRWSVGYFTDEQSIILDFTNSGGYANDSSAHGQWSASIPESEVATRESKRPSGSGYFDCTIADEGDLSACGGTFDLPINQWRQISLPCHASPSLGISDLFSNIPGTYDTDWVVYGYSTYLKKYSKLSINDSLRQGVGYWIIQINNNPVTLAMPQGSIPTLASQFAACSSAKGCIEIPLTVTSYNPWNMIGYPYDKESILGGTRVTSKSPSCDTKVGCTLSDAKTLNMVHNQLLNWVGHDTGYVEANIGDTLNPWKGYWSATLTKTNKDSPIKLLMPKP